MIDKLLMSFDKTFCFLKLSESLTFCSLISEQLSLLTFGILVD